MAIPEIDRKTKTPISGAELENFVTTIRLKHFEKPVNVVHVIVGLITSLITAWFRSEENTPSGSWMVVWLRLSKQHFQIAGLAHASEWWQHESESLGVDALVPRVVLRWNCAKLIAYRRFIDNYLGLKSYG